MLKEVILADNPFEVETYKRYEVDNVFDFIMSKYKEWPETARIYNKTVSLDNDVTPQTEEDIENFSKLEGPFYVIVYPGDPIDIVIAVIAVVLVAAIAAAFLLAPSIPSPATRNSDTQSPNNELSSRTNKARPNGRIPDIYGTVRSTPDLLTNPYKVFVNHQEVEFAYMCVGRGSYDISDVRDDKTLISEVEGASVEVYAPFTSPNLRGVEGALIVNTLAELPYFPGANQTAYVISDGANNGMYQTYPSGMHYHWNKTDNSQPVPPKQLVVGGEINEPLLDTYRSNSVNGQVLRAPNDKFISGRNNIWFVKPNEIKTNYFDFTYYFSAGDIVTIENAKVYSSSATNLLNCKAEAPNLFYISIPSTSVPAIYSVGKNITLNGQFSYTVPETAEHGSYQVDYDISGSYEIANVEFRDESTYDVDGITLIGDAKYFVKLTLKYADAINTNWQKADGAIIAPVYVTIASGSLLYDLAGSYTILSVSTTLIVLDNPAGTNAYWDTMPTTTPKIDVALSTGGSKWIGPFTFDSDKLTQVFGNFVALNGLYADNGTSQVKISVDVELELTPINADGSARGPAESFVGTIEGSPFYKSTRALTVKATPTFTGRCSVRARRVTSDFSWFKGNVVDEIKWRDAYSVAEVTNRHFGDVTTVFSVTYATAAALAVKDRKLNMLVTRKLPQRISGSNFTTELFPTNNAAEILSAICLDKFIGNRNVNEVDFDNIYDTVSQINTYFGTSIASEFNYTFDKSNLSFEETVASIASAIFCTGYRRGNLIKLSFEKQTEDSTLLFNHRNKVPGSETRTVTFGNDNDNDGVELTYVDPEDDAIVTMFLPEDQSAINPIKYETIGVRNKLQAWFLAYRAYNKLIYQNVSLEFEGTQEAGILVLKDRILVADNTRPDTQDGEVVTQDGLNLTLSQDADLSKYESCVIFLQHVDGSLESISITAGATPNNVVLSQPPRMALSLDYDNYARTTYVIVGNDELAQKPFLVTEKTPQSNFTTILKASNYDDRYYNNDFDFINGIIDADGNII